MLWNFKQLLIYLGNAGLQAREVLDQQVLLDADH